MTGNFFDSPETKQIKLGKARQDAKDGIQRETAPEIEFDDMRKMLEVHTRITSLALEKFLKGMLRLLMASDGPETPRQSWKCETFTMPNLYQNPLKALFAKKEIETDVSELSKLLNEYCEEVGYTVNASFVIQESRVGGFRGDAYDMRENAVQEGVMGVGVPRIRLLLPVSTVTNRANIDYES